MSCTCGIHNDMICVGPADGVQSCSCSGIIVTRSQGWEWPCKRALFLLLQWYFSARVYIFGHKKTTASVCQCATASSTSSGIIRRLLKCGVKPGSRVPVCRMLATDLAAMDRVGGIIECSLGNLISWAEELNYLVVEGLILPMRSAVGV
jgi:hypothetical protein